MADIFVSYARADKARVAPLVAALEAEGWSVWWDPAIAPGQEFDDLITAELERALVVIVVWTPTSVGSRWVRGEARFAADRGKLVPVRLDAAALPLDARALHTTELDGWRDDRGSLEYKELMRALSPLLGARDAQGPEMAAESAHSRKPEVSILVLPFANMSGDPEQEYFSDGISEDIITDLSKVSALWVAARNTAFAYKGKHVDVPQVARQQRVSHVLEGSVRKSGNRVRITAQLIEGATGGHVWAERYDRDLNDIFALQDEISQAIVAALKCKLLPEEKEALGERGTTNPEAYKLYLMARQYHITADERRRGFVVRLCQRAVEIDPNYARAWALLALGQSNIRLLDVRASDNGWDAANRALALDADLAEARSARGRILADQARYDEALKEHEAALELDPESYEVNCAAARCYMAMQRYSDAIACYERAFQSTETDFWAVGMCIQAYKAIGDRENELRTAKITLRRAEQRLATEPDNSNAVSFGLTALATLGENERAHEWMERALILNPHDSNLRYNSACALILMGEHDRALALLDHLVANAQTENFNWFKTDNDLDPIREDPRFRAMMAAAETRLAQAAPKS